MIKRINYFNLVRQIAAFILVAVSVHEAIPGAIKFAKQIVQSDDPSHFIWGHIVGLFIIAVMGMVTYSVFSICLFNKYVAFRIDSFILGFFYLVVLMFNGYGDRIVDLIYYLYLPYCFIRIATSIVESRYRQRKTEKAIVTTAPIKTK